MVGGFLVATRELLSKVPTNNKKYPIVELARASMTGKTACSAIAAREIRLRVGTIPLEIDKGKETASAVKDLISLAKQRIRELRKALSALRVDVKEVKDISSVGKRVCAMLTTSAHVTILIRKSVLEGSTITRLEKVDPLSSDNLKRARGARDKLPEELLI